MATISLRHIDKIYDNKKQIVFDFNLDIDDREFIVFVGPSGCGKSTTLRMIAGLEDITKGEFYIDSDLMNDVSPKDRNIAMVFQNYALYPHMSIYENIAFPLRIKKVAPEIIDEKVRHAAELLELTSYLDSKPKQLSGGQRQRVALGRAIVKDSKVLLMDEPLSNLDAKLRVSMRSKIIELHNDIERTTIYVTHDQIEAMTMASRIVVMKDGYIMQVGAPIEIYNDPANIFVASFIGTPAMNFIHGTISEKRELVVDENTRIKIDNDNYDILLEKGYLNKEVVLGIRPEHIYDGRVYNGVEKTSFNALVTFAELLGNDYNIYFKVGNDEIIAKVKAGNLLHHGSNVKVILDSTKFYFFDKESGRRIRNLIELVPNYRGDGLGTSYNMIFDHTKTLELANIEHGFKQLSKRIKCFALDSLGDKTISSISPDLYKELSTNDSLKIYVIWEDDPDYVTPIASVDSTANEEVVSDVSNTTTNGEL